MDFTKRKFGGFKKSGNADQEPKKPVRTFAAKGLSLPTERNVPSDDISDYSMLLYGERKIGKTTLMCMFPKPLIISFEPGAEATDAYVVRPQTWPEFMGYVDLLLKEKHDFKNVVIDTGQVAYEMAFDYACFYYDIEHPGAIKDYGASWSKVRKVFLSPMRDLIQSRDLSLKVIAHEKEAEIETQYGQTFIKMRPNFSGQADEFFTSQIDNVFYYHFVNGKRYLQIEGDDYITAGHRIRDHFYIGDTDERVVNIPMGNTEEEAYSALLDAFDNKQEKAYDVNSLKKERVSEFKKKK